MNEYNALFEDEDDIIAGSPRKRYWDIWGQVETDKVQNEFDKVMDQIAAMEQMPIEEYGEQGIDSAVARYIDENPEAVEMHKKTLYLEYGAKLIFAQND
ncbi:MAG: DUF2018 family protein [Campylobacterales bacterium]|nr:DUF2018 family protein [Campylobacterales bacterium]